MEKKYTRLLLIFIVLIILTSVAGYKILSRKSNIFKQIKTETLPIPSAAEIPSPQPTEKIISEKFFLIVDSPAERQTFNSPAIFVAGRTVAGAEVWVNDKPAQVDSFGNFNFRITLEEGENYLLISAGNEEVDDETERMVYYER